MSTPQSMLTSLTYILRIVGCSTGYKSTHFSSRIIPVIAMLGKRLTLRQRVIATATVFFRRFYVKNLYCETDPFIVIAACCYVAAKAEESPVHIKNVVSESRVMFGRTCAS